MDRLGEGLLRVQPIEERCRTQRRRTNQLWSLAHQPLGALPAPGPLSAPAHGGTARTRTAVLVVRRLAVLFRPVHPGRRVSCSECFFGSWRRGNGQRRVVEVRRLELGRASDPSSRRGTTRTTAGYSRLRTA